MSKDETTKEPVMVQIPKEEFDQLKETVKSLQEKGEFLEAVADKKQVATYYARNKSKLPSIIRLRTLDGKAVVGWGKIKDEVYKDSQTGRWKEEQIIEVIFEDGTSQQMDYVTFSRRYDHVKCEKVGEITDEIGNVTLKLRRIDNDKEYQIPVQFVN